MTKLEELKLQLEEAKAKCSEAYTPLEAKYNAIEKKWTSMLNTLLPVKTKIRISLDYEASILIEVVDEKDEPIFGADVDMYVYQNSEPWEKRNSEEYVPTYRLEVSTGTCGTFNQTNYGQINKYKIMGILCENFDLLDSVFTEDVKDLRPIRQIYSKASYEREKLEDEIKDEEDRIKQEEFASTIDFNAVYKVERSSFYNKQAFEGFNYLKFEKTTDNYEYLTVGTSDYVYDKETDKYRETGNFRPYKSKRYTKGLFVRWLMKGQIKKVVANTEI